MSHDPEYDIKELDIAAEEEYGDKVNQRLVEAVETICSILKDEAEYVRPSEAGQVVRAFVPTLNLATDLDPDFLKEALFRLRSLTDKAIGELLLAIPITQEGGHFDEINQHLAVDVARVLGPDHAQAWYRFAVLVTKLA